MSYKTNFDNKSRPKSEPSISAVIETTLIPGHFLKCRSSRKTRHRTSVKLDLTISCRTKHNERGKFRNKVDSEEEELLEKTQKSTGEDLHTKILPTTANDSTSFVYPQPLQNLVHYQSQQMRFNTTFENDLNKLNLKHESIENLIVTPKFNSSKSLPNIEQQVHPQSESHTCGPVEIVQKPRGIETPKATESKEDVTGELTTLPLLYNANPPLSSHSHYSKKSLDIADNEDITAANPPPNLGMNEHAEGFNYPEFSYDVYEECRYDKDLQSTSPKKLIDNLEFESVVNIEIPTIFTTEVMETDLQQTTNYSGEKGIRHYSNVETESQLIAEKTPSLLMLTLSNSKLVHDELVDNGSKKIVRTPLKESKDLSIEQTSKFNDAFQKYAQESQVSLNEVSEDLKAVRITSYLLLNQRTEPTYLLEETDENEGFKISTPNILHRKTDVSESQMYTGKKSNQALQNPLANKSSIPDNSEGKTVDSKEIVQSQTVFTNAFSRTVETEETTTVSIAYSDQKLRDHENRQYELKQSTDGENGMHYQELPGLFMESQQTVILDSYQTNCQTQTESSIKTEQCVEPILSTESNKSVPVSVSITSSQVDQSDATDDCSQLQGQDHFPYIVYKQDENKTHRYSLDKFITIEISTEKSVSNEPIDKPVLDAKFDGEIRKPYFNETQLSQKHLAKISSDENNFKREIKEFLSKQEQNIIIEHESDEKYSSDVNTLQVIETHTPEPQKPSLTNISLNSSRKGILSSVVSTNSFVVRSITETPSTLPVHFRGLNIEMERVHSTRSETSIHSHSTPSPILVPEDQLGSFLPVTKEPDLTNFTPLILPARNLKTSEAMDTETDASKKEVQPSIVQTVIPVSPEVNTSETSIFIQKTDMSKKLESMSSESSDHLVSNQKADLVPPTYDKDFVSNMSTSKILHSHRFVELTISDTHLHEVNPSEIPPVVVNKEFKSFSVQNNEGIIDDIKNAITSQFKGPVESLDWCISEETRNGTQLYVNDPPFKILKDPELPSTPVSTTPENTQFTPINVPTLEAVDSMKVLNDSVKDELYQQTVDTKADVFGNLSQVEVSISMEHTDNMNRLDFVHSVESNKYTDPEYIPPLSLEIDDQELTCLPPKISFKETHFKSVEVPTEKPQVVTVPTIQPYHIKQESTPSLVPLNLLINLTKCNIGVTNSLEQNQLKEAVDSVSSAQSSKNTKDRELNSMHSTLKQDASFMATDSSDENHHFMSPTMTSEKLKIVNYVTTPSCVPQEELSRQILQKTSPVNISINQKDPIPVLQPINIDRHEASNMHELVQKEKIPKANAIDTQNEFSVRFEEQTQGCFTLSESFKNYLDGRNDEQLENITNKLSQSLEVEKMSIRSTSSDRLLDRMYSSAISSTDPGQLLDSNRQVNFIHLSRIENNIFPQVDSFHKQEVTKGQSLEKTEVSESSVRVNIIKSDENSTETSEIVNKCGTSPTQLTGVSRPIIKIATSFDHSEECTKQPPVEVKSQVALSNDQILTNLHVQFSDQNKPMGIKDPVLVDSVYKLHSIHDISPDDQSDNRQFSSVKVSSEQDKEEMNLIDATCSKNLQLDNVLTGPSTKIKTNQTDSSSFVQSKAPRNLPRLFSSNLRTASTTLLRLPELSLPFCSRNLSGYSSRLMKSSPGYPSNVGTHGVDMQLHLRTLPIRNKYPEKFDKNGRESSYCRQHSQFQSVSAPCRSPQRNHSPFPNYCQTNPCVPPVSHHSAIPCSCSMIPRSHSHGSRYEDGRVMSTSNQPITTLLSCHHTKVNVEKYQTSSRENPRDLNQKVNHSPSSNRRVSRCMSPCVVYSYCSQVRYSHGLLCCGGSLHRHKSMAYLSTSSNRRIPEHESYCNINILNKHDRATGVSHLKLPLNHFYQK